MAVGHNFTGVTCVGLNACKIGDVTLTLSRSLGGLRILWDTDNLTRTFEDCFDFPNDVNWFGGPERSTQLWPLEKMNITGPYVIKKNDNFGVAERYWLNSKGTYIYVNTTVPLFVEQRSHNQVCFVSKVDGPYVNRKSVSKRNFVVFTFPNPNLISFSLVVLDPTN